MSFIGLVTRKDKDTGVNLLAKVVTPSKKKSGKKAFKVKVKANALDDFSCCVIDHATAKNNIENSQDLSAVMNDFNFTYNGINGTNISYRLVDTTNPGISAYITEDGKLLNRPKFGDSVVSGYIEITVTKNEAQVQSRIIITLQPLTAEEILNDPDIINDVLLWNYIRNGNTAQNNIVNDLRLIEEIAVDGSIQPINVAYVVTDSTLAYARPYESARIDQETGKLIRPTYKEACEMVRNHETTDINVSIVNTADNGAMGRCVRIGGLKLVATLTLGDATRIINYNLSTLSKYITCEEIIEAVASQLCIFRADYTKIEYADTADSSFETLTAPTSGGRTKIRAYYGAVAESFTYDPMLLEQNDILGVTISNVFCGFDGGDYPSAGTLTTAFDGGFIAETDGDSEHLYYDVLNINYDALKNVADNLKQFSIQTLIKVSGYSSNGTNPQGGQLTQTRKVRFKVNTASIA